MKRCLALILGLMILVISVPAHAVSFTFDQACGFIDSTKIDDQIVFTNKTYGPVGESSPIRSLPHDTKGGLVIIWEVDYPLGLLSLFKPDSYDGAVWDFEYDTSDARKDKIIIEIVGYSFAGLYRL